jgi:hypothetical protein
MKPLVLLLVLRLDKGSSLVVAASAVGSCTSAKVKRESLPGDGLLCDTDPNPGFQPYSEESMIGMKSGLTVQNFTDFVSESVHRPLIWNFSVGAPSDSAR